MNQNKPSSRVYNIIKSAAAAAVLPVLFIYIMIAKPDYTLLNGMAHVVLPVANWVGDVITWPIRAIGNAIDGVGELSNLREENEELRVRLDQALADKHTCDIAIKENQKLNQELNIVNSQIRKSVVADIIYQNDVLHHSTFIINRGTENGINKGQVVVSMSNQLIGIVIDTGDNFARVRALNDSDTNIAVRIVGSEVYGFLTGNGSNTPSIGFFSDPQFQPTDGLILTTSNISGVLPNNIIVGETVNQTDVKIFNYKKATRVMVLQFDNIGEYK